MIEDEQQAHAAAIGISASSTHSGLTCCAADAIVCSFGRTPPTSALMPTAAAQRTRPGGQTPSSSSAHPVVTLLQSNAAGADARMKPPAAATT